MPTILGTIAASGNNNVNHTLVAASNRIGIGIAVYEAGKPTPPATVDGTYGGQECIEIDLSPAESTVGPDTIHMYYILEAALATAGDGVNNFSVPGISSVGRRLHFFTYSDAKQAAPDDTNLKIGTGSAKVDLDLTSLAPNSVFLAAIINRVLNRLHTWTSTAVSPTKLWDENAGSDAQSSAAHEVVAATGLTTISVEPDASGDIAMLGIVIAPAATMPVISSADDYDDDDTTYTITGTDLDLIVGVLTVEVGGVSANVSASNSTTLTIDVPTIPPSGAFSPYGIITVDVKEDAASVGTTTLTHTPGASEQYVVLASPGADPDVHLTAHFKSPDPVSDDQLYGDKVTSTGKAITYYATGDFSIAGYNPEVVETFSAGHLATSTSIRYSPSLFTISDGVISSVNMKQFSNPFSNTFLKPFSNSIS